MSSITANDLKTRGVAAIESALADRSEAVVSVRGTDRFVVMELAHYHHLRECELEAALAESRADLAAGRWVKESPEAHVERALTKNKPRAQPAGRANAAKRRATTR